MRVRVYKNLNDGLISIKLRTTGLVIAHCEEITLGDVSFKVYESGRQRVIKQKRKNVHAYVEGEILSVKGLKPYKGRGITIPEEKSAQAFDSRIFYNPYKTANFITSSDIIVESCEICRVSFHEGITANNIFTKSID